jgi:hypothetical protein
MDQTADIFASKRRAPRVGFELPVRCKHGLTRFTAMLKDMTRFGARIEGIDATEVGEAITLLLPGQAARMAFVVWINGKTSGLEFGDPLAPEMFDTLIGDYAIGHAPQPAPPPRPIRAAA